MSPRQVPEAAPAADRASSAANTDDLAGPQLELYQPLCQRLLQGAPVLDERSALVDRALAVWARPGFETFVCMPRLRFEPFPDRKSVV